MATPQSSAREEMELELQNYVEEDLEELQAQFDNLRSTVDNLTATVEIIESVAKDTARKVSAENEMEAVSDFLGEHDTELSNVWDVLQALEAKVDENPPSPSFCTLLC